MAVGCKVGVIVAVNGGVLDFVGTSVIDGIRVSARAVWATSVKLVASWIEFSEGPVEQLAIIPAIIIKTMAIFALSTGILILNLIGVIGI